MNDGPERMGAVAPATYDEDQRRAAAAFEATRGAALFGPFERLVRSPEVLTHAQALGEYLRYRSSLGQRISEMVILITARFWDQAYEWSLHAPLALKHGVSETIIATIGAGRRPETMAEDEAAAHDFSVELHRSKVVSDATYARALALFGERGVVDLTAVNGYYALLAMQMNVMRTPPVAGGPPLPAREVSGPGP